MNIRPATNYDADKIYELHVSSIKHYCSNFYPEFAITSWVGLKSPAEYKNLPTSRIIVVAEQQSEIVGFGMINLDKATIEGLYLKPGWSDKGVGRLLLEKLESIATQNKIDALKANSTLNAVDFYHHMGYIGNEESLFTLSSGVQLRCVVMSKRLLSNN